MEGTVIAGRFRVVRLIGRGGMGEVYEAVQLDLDRPVAIKVLPPGTGDLGAIEREARAAARLAHPHIVQVTDLVQPDEGAPFLVMELLEGESVAERLARERRIDASRSALIAVQVLSALAAAHAAGIVHRDVKPANIFLARTAATHDFVKLLDFGVARVSHGSPGSVTSARLVGTPAYMAPEQIRGDTADARTDVYAVGVCLYEMLSGGSPFTATNVPSLLVKICESEPDPLAGVAPELAAVVTRAMSKDANARYSTADAMRVALVPFAASAPVPSRAISPPPRISPEREAASTVPIEPLAHDAPAPPSTKPTPLAERTLATMQRTLASSGPEELRAAASPASPLVRWAPATLAAALVAAVYGFAPPRDPVAPPPPPTAPCAVAPMFDGYALEQATRMSIAASGDDVLVVASSLDGTQLPIVWRASGGVMSLWREATARHAVDGGAESVFASAALSGSTPVLAGVRRLASRDAAERSVLEVETPEGTSLDVKLGIDPSRASAAISAPFTIVASASLVFLGGHRDFLLEARGVAVQIFRDDELAYSAQDMRRTEPLDVRTAAGPSVLGVLARHEQELVVYAYEIVEDGTKVRYASTVLVERDPHTGEGPRVVDAAVAAQGSSVLVVWSEGDDVTHWAVARGSGGVASEGSVLGGRRASGYALGVRGDRVAFAWLEERKGRTIAMVGDGRDVPDAASRAVELEATGPRDLALSSGSETWLAWTERGMTGDLRRLHTAYVRCK